MSMEITEKGTKKFTREEKLQILKEAKENGVKVTLLKYDLYPGTYYYWKRKLLVHGEDGLNHQTARKRENRIRKLEKENEQLKILLAEKELESKLKDEVIKKKVSRVEKVELVRDYMGKGMKRDQCLDIVSLSRHQYYYEPSGVKPGKQPSKTTLHKDHVTLEYNEVENDVILDQIISIKLDVDQPNWYRLITAKLQLSGYYINHKKVYRIMREDSLLERKQKTTGKTWVKYRRVAPTEPLTILEMDIKYVWIYEVRRYAFILTVIDTFTRYVLHWTVGYTMKHAQVRQVWEYIIAEYLQGYRQVDSAIDIELRTDNGKQFCARKIMEFFEENYIDQVFTHPYTPEENGHVESFHKTLEKSLEKDQFTSLAMLEKRLEKFYQTYNNDRPHSGTREIPPGIFWALYDQDQIEVIQQEKRIIRFQLKVAIQDILTLPGIDKYNYRVNEPQGALARVV